MLLFLSGVLLCLAKTATGDWLKDFISPKGWQVGDGLVLRLVDSHHPNSTLLERHAIAVDYGGYGVSVGKVPKRSAVELGFYADSSGEARGSKENSAMNIIIGYKLATIVSFVLSGMAAFVLKALGVAKLAAIVSTILLVSKLFYGQKEDTYHKIPATFELEHGDAYPSYSEYPVTEVEYHPSGSATYYSYANLPPDVDYVDASGGNVSYPGIAVIPGNQQVVSRRRDVPKKEEIPLLRIHEYSVDS